MKVKDIPILKQKVLAMLPIKQSEVWKTLGIDSRDCSHIIGDMVKENLITKKKADKTFLLERISISGNGNDNGNGENKDKEVEKKKIDSTVLLSKEGRFAPCCGCQLECIPAKCNILTKWILEC